MAMTYTDALLVLSSVESTMLKNTDDMYGKVLLNQVAPTCKFLQYIGIGLDGIIILADDVTDMRQVIFKFAKPQKSKQQRINAIKEKAKAVFKRRLTITETTDTQRFLRSAVIQQKISTFIKDNAKASSLGRVPEVYAVGKSPYLYIKMEYVKGPDLMSWIKTEQNETTRIKLIRDACELIKISMHDNNIIHSDLKPSNFIISGTGSDYRIAIIDFNGAKNMDDSFSITVADETRYSLPYSSKNQIDNYNYRTFADDVYSMGVIFYNAITQKTPEELILENPTATNFSKMHPLHNIKNTDCWAIFNRATGAGFKYSNFEDMIFDIDNKVLKKKTVESINFNFIDSIVKIWTEYIENKQKFKEGEKNEKKFFDIIAND